MWIISTKIRFGHVTKEHAPKTKELFGYGYAIIIINIIKFQLIDLTTITFTDWAHKASTNPHTQKSSIHTVNYVWINPPRVYFINKQKLFNW